MVSEPASWAISAKTVVDWCTDERTIKLGDPDQDCGGLVYRRTSQQTGRFQAKTVVDWRIGGQVSKLGDLEAEAGGRL